AGRQRHDDRMTNLAALLFDMARRLPERPAVSDDGSSRTYRELAERVARLAGGLRAYGLAPGDRVLLALENCSEFFELLFACWTAGLCAVPTNARLHPREVEYIAENSGARLLVATPTLAEALVPLEASVASLERVISTRNGAYDALLASGEPLCPEPATSAPTDTAWLFYTSGTTGRPKGVMLTHRNLTMAALCYHADVDTIEGADCIVHAAPMSHGSGLYIAPHVAKAACHVVPESAGFDAPEICRLLDRHRGVTMFYAPTMVRRLIDYRGLVDAKLANLKTIVYGGAPMYVADLEEAMRILGNKLIQIYGQGESPMTITCLSRRHHWMKDDPRHEAHLTSAGLPFTGMEVMIADGADNPLPAGETGEVLARGDAVMKGYWRNPEATAAALRGGWLHTGDVGALDEEGFLTLKDRSKDLIISGGTNIYPREVEGVLLKHESVHEVSVIGRPHPDWGEEVVAFVVAAAGERVGSEELDRLCLDNIARFKRPKEYRFVDALPKNNYGKILKTELRERLKAER